MKRSKFNLSHRHHTTMEMGKLIPFFVRDCLPGDIHRISSQAIFRAIPMLAPLISKVEYITQYYFVPYRLLWSDWTEFITGGDDGLAAPEFPTIKAPIGQGWQANTLADYFGFPVGQPEVEVSAMPFRAMCKIWNDHYKIDDIEADIEYSIDSGLDTTTPTDLLNCHWSRDVFVRAKPFTQRGSQVSVPIEPAIVDKYAYPITLKTITQNGESTTIKPSDEQIIGKIYIESWNTDFSKVIVKTFEITKTPTDNSYIFVQTVAGSVSPKENVYIPVSVLVGEISSYSDNQTSKVINYGGNVRAEGQKYIVTGFTAQLESTALNKISVGKIGSLNIRDLRIASALQRFQEKSLKYGAEYEDYCKMEFKVTPRDARLQKSEYLGGSKSILQISEIFQTTDTADTPLGAQAGYGIGQLKQRRIKYFCPEHGIIIGLLSYRPATIYSQGIEREFLKRNRFDYFTREFVDIGAQEILEQEIFATADNKDKVFGYDLNGNYQEYRSKRNRITGNFKTDLSFWTLARKFEQAPVLNASFMKMSPQKDIFAITDQSLPAFITMIQNQVIAYRPIPKRSRNLLK